MHQIAYAILLVRRFGRCIGLPLAIQLAPYINVWAIALLEIAMYMTKTPIRRCSLSHALGPRALKSNLKAAASESCLGLG